MQKEGQNSLYKILKNYIPNTVLSNKNRARTWEYGYNEKYDFVCISQNGQLGDVVQISGLNIGLPPIPKKIHTRSKTNTEQYWERTELPRELNRIQSIFQWNEMPPNFKTKWVDYIEKEFDKREEGLWFMNNGQPTYITGSHYMYLQWSAIDVGYPEFREANRIFYIFWEACKNDKNSYGMCFLKNRRSGFSYMASSEIVNQATQV